MTSRQTSLILSAITGLLVFVLLLPAKAFAKTEVIYATHKSVMGDNDSKNDVRRMCFLEAKRKVLERAGKRAENMTIELRTSNGTFDNDDWLYRMSAK